MKVVHAADLHLDSPLRGLERYEGAPVERIRLATRHAFENLVELCRAEAVSLLLIAGDLYDGSWKDYSTGLFFAKQMSKLREAGVQVVWVRGNHDAVSQIAKQLQLPDNVHELPWRKPDSVVFDELGVAVHGQSFPKKAVTEDLAAGYPAPLEGLVNFGLLHTSVNGRQGHEPYAPCSLETLIGKGYQYWALGHVHQREVLSDTPWVVFPGNLQGRHARETGPKGASLVQVEGGRIQSVEHHTLDAVRWAEVVIDASEASSADDVVELVRDALGAEHDVAEGRLLAARVVVEGGSRAHDQLAADPEQWEQSIRAAASDVASEGVWVEKVRLATHPEISWAKLAERDDPIGALVGSIEAAQRDPERLSELLELFTDLRRKLPHELRSEEGLRLDDPETIRAALADVQKLVLPRLLAGGKAR